MIRAAILSAVLLLPISAIAQEPESEESVVVTGRRTEDAVRDFVGAMSVTPQGNDQLARWDRRICPGVAGLRTRYAQFMIDRLAQLLASMERGQLPVRCTAIYSRTDGIVPWRGCVLDEGERTENVEVISSHVGLVSNPLALAAVADRLAQDVA